MIFIIQVLFQKMVLKVSYHQKSESICVCTKHECNVQDEESYTQQVYNRHSFQCMSISASSCKLTFKWYWVSIFQSLFQKVGLKVSSHQKKYPGNFWLLLQAWMKCTRRTILHTTSVGRVLARISNMPVQNSNFKISACPD